MITEYCLKLRINGSKMYTQQELLDKLNQVCKKYDITSYELDVKLSQALLKTFTMEQIKDGNIIMKALDKLIARKK